MITLYFHWKSVKWIISKIETSDIFILKHLITLEKLRLLDRYFCFFWIDFVTNLWNVGFFFFAFTHSVDLQVDENDESKASPPLDPPPTRSPNRSPRMGRSVKARSMVIGKQINFQSYMPTIPSQIPKSQTLPANMSTPIITVRCHGNHDLPKKKTRSV